MRDVSSRLKYRIENRAPYNELKLSLHRRARGRIMAYRYWKSGNIIIYLPNILTAIIYYLLEYGYNDYDTLSWLIVHETCHNLGISHKRARSWNWI